MAWYLAATISLLQIFELELGRTDDAKELGRKKQAELAALQLELHELNQTARDEESRVRFARAHVRKGAHVRMLAGVCRVERKRRRTLRLPTRPSRPSLRPSRPRSNSGSTLRSPPGPDRPAVFAFSVPLVFG